MSKNIGILVAPSAAGKTEIAKRLTGRCKITTCTTRDMRPKEVNGIDYHFFNEKEFKEMIKNGDFVEYSCYAGNYYGTRFKELDEALAEDKKIIIVMDINGAKAIRERYPDKSTAIFIDRPKRDLIMAILERPVSNEEKTNRILQLEEDYKVRFECDVVVRNVILEDAVKDVEKHLA